MRKITIGNFTGSNLDDNGLEVRRTRTALAGDRAQKGKLEIRADSNSRTVSGYAVVYDQETLIGDAYAEVVREGAFTETLKTADVRALFNHDSGRPLGRTSAGTLRLRDDNFGLWFSLDLPNTRDGDDALSLIRRGDLDGMSFGFVVPRGGDRWSRRSDGMELRELLQVDLLEISIVTFPAYKGTSAGVA